MYVINTQECNRQGCRGSLVPPRPGSLPASCRAHPRQVWGPPPEDSIFALPFFLPMQTHTSLTLLGLRCSLSHTGGGGNCPSVWMPASHPGPPRTLTLTPVRAAFLPASVTCSPLGNLVKNADYWVLLPEVMTQSIDTRWWNPQPQQLLLMQVVWVTISEIPFSSGIIRSKGKAHLIFWHVLLNHLSERLYPGATPPAMRSSSSLSPNFQQSPK